MTPRQAWGAILAPGRPAYGEVNVVLRAMVKPPAMQGLNDKNIWRMVKNVAPRFFLPRPTRWDSVSLRKAGLREKKAAGGYAI